MSLKIIYYDFKNIYKSRFIFLPNNFNKSIDNFINIIEQKYVDYYWLGGKMERFDLEEADKIFYAYHEIFDSFRKFLGIKKLSDETKNLIRESTEQR